MMPSYGVFPEAALPVRRTLEACSPAERSASREYIWIIQVKYFIQIK